MLFTASLRDLSRHRGKALNVTRTAGSPFAPSRTLLTDYQAHRCTWEDYERRYLLEMRADYQANRARWHAVVREASFGDVTLLCYERGAEETVECHRRLLKGMLVAVGLVLGVRLTEDAGEPVLKGGPLKCVYCERAAPASSQVPQMIGYGVCSPACEWREARQQHVLEQDQRGTE